MRQVLQDARSGAIRVEEVPAPQLLPGCVLVRIAASVVSAGTERASAEFARKNLLQKARSRPDLVREVISKVQRDGIVSAVQAVRSRLDQPQSPGYSSAGTVLAIGEGVTDIQLGDRVACAGAGFAVHAEIACIPRLLLARIPAGSPVSGSGAVPLDQAAFATVGAVALHGIRTAEAKLGDMVAVIGLGLLGQLTAQLLKAAGCYVLGMDIDPSRAQLASHMGADAIATSASEFRNLCLQASRGSGVDCVLITAETPSSDPVNLAGAIARDRAVVVAVGTVGMDIERKSFYEKELQFRISRSYGPGRYDTAFEQKGRDYPIGYVRWTETRNMEAFVELLAEGRLNLDPLISHRFPIQSAHRAYELISGKAREPFLGVVIQYGEAGDTSPRLALASASGIPGQLRTITNDVTVGLLGAGGFASSTLIPAMKSSSHTSLLTICAATGSHAKHAASEFGFRNCTTDNAGLMRDSEINTVVIATRHHLHARQVLSALSAAKNVFCEKPLCLSEEQLKKIVSVYMEIPPAQKTALMVGFNRRFAPMVTQMKTFLAAVAEPLALHYRINAGYLPPDHWMNDREQGGGRVLGEVCHFLDLIMFLAGSPIVEVSTREIGSTGRYSADNVLISVRFGNGSEGIVSYLANGDRCFSKERIEVFGGGSTAVLDDFRRMELVRNGRAQTVRSRLRQDKGHRAEWAAFVDRIRLGKDAPIAFEDIVCSTLATLRAEESRIAGKPLAVDAAGLLRSCQMASTLHADRNQ
jgi:predicted dehydrogenase/threonine dehydrogenase-like Zn-dependent dehydrogenase